MIGDLARAVLAENLAKNRAARRAMLNLKGLPLNEDDSPISNPDVRYTNMIYYVHYDRDSQNSPHKKYTIKCDLANGDSSMKITEYNGEIKARKKEYEAILEWLLKYTNLSSELLSIARQNALMNIPIAFDVIKYDKHIRKQCKKKIHSTIMEKPWWEKYDYENQDARRAEEKRIADETGVEVSSVGELPWWMKGE